MGFHLLLLLALSLLFATVAPARENSTLSSCSSKLQAHHSHHKASKGSVHLPLHHPRSPCSPAPLPNSVPFSTILLHDENHVLSLSSRLREERRHPSSSDADLSTSSASSPLKRGTSLGVGSYVTNIRLGTPSSSYAMLVDTGSSLTWLQCSPCNVSCHKQADPIFDPSASTSYSSISCFASECSFLASATHNPYSCSHSDVCTYEAIYADNSFSAGFLGEDTLKLGSLVVPKFIHGCGQANEGLYGRTAGLIGLAQNNLSLVAQVSKKTGAHAFSYCLPTTRSTGVLSLGSYAASKFQFTPMVKSALDAALYSIKLSSIKLNSKRIPASSSSYDTPLIIDSGTVISRLPPDVYLALSGALAAALKNKYERAPAYSILDTCFRVSADKVVLPRVSMVFEGGAEIKLPAGNVMTDVDDATTCLAFAPAREVAILGSRQQQTFSVVFDVAKEKIGFASGGCG